MRTYKVRVTDDDGTALRHASEGKLLTEAELRALARMYERLLVERKR